MSRGRPKGARNKGLLLLEKMQDQDLDIITNNLVDLAKNGDFSAISLIVNKVFALPKAPSSVNLDLMKGIKTQSHVNEAMTNLLDSVGSGEVGLDDAKELVELIGAKAATIQKCNFEDIEYIKKMLAEKK